MCHRERLANMWRWRMGINFNLLYITESWLTFTHYFSIWGWFSFVEKVENSIQNTIWKSFGLNFYSEFVIRVKNVRLAAEFKAFWLKLKTRSSVRLRSSANFSMREKNYIDLQMWSPKIPTTFWERGLFPAQVCFHSWGTHLQQTSIYIKFLQLICYYLDKIQ